MSNPGVVAVAPDRFYEEGARYELDARSLPVFAPIEVGTITGLPRRSPPCSPFVAS